MARSGPGPRISAPSHRISPAVGSSRPAIRLSRVLLPQPEWPIRQTNSFRSTASETLSSARKLPLPLAGNAIETSRTLKNAIARSFPEAQALADPGEAEVEAQADDADQHDRHDHAGNL